MVATRASAPRMIHPTSWALKLRSPSEKNGTGSCAREAWTGQPDAEFELVVLMVVKEVVRGGA